MLFRKQIQVIETDVIAARATFAVKKLNIHKSHFDRKESLTKQKCFNLITTASEDINSKI